MRITDLSTRLPLSVQFERPKGLISRGGLARSGFQDNRDSGQV